MRLVSLLLATFISFPAYAEEGIIFATKDDIKAFDQLIHKRRVTAKRSPKITKPHTQKVRALVRKEAFKKNKEILAKKHGSAGKNNRRVPAKATSRARVKTSTNARSRSTSSVRRSSSSSRNNNRSRSREYERHKKRHKERHKKHKKKHRRDDD